MSRIKFFGILMQIILILLPISITKSYSGSAPALKHYNEALRYLEIKDPSKVIDAEEKAREELKTILDKYADSDIAEKAYYLLEYLMADKELNLRIPESYIDILYAYRKKLSKYGKNIKEKSLTHVVFGHTYFANKKYDKAIVELKKSLELFNMEKQHKHKWIPAHVYHLLGGCYEAKKMYREALDAFEKANAIEPYKDKTYIKKIKELKGKAGQ